VRRGLIVLLAAVLAGCATPYVRGRDALLAERYDEAAGHFRQALEADPARADALTGLGVALYKQGALDAALDVLRRAVGAAPGSPEGRLYLGLVYLRRGQERAAEAEFAALRTLRLHPRLAAQLERAERVLRLADLADDVRQFVAAGLEDEALWEADVRRAQQIPRGFLQPTWLLYWDARDRYPGGWCP
jgi:tetratricopeptide (TPR) repeat protein